MTTKLPNLDERQAPELLQAPRWVVDLHMQFDETDAPTAVDAVSQFLVAILYRGMSGMTFTVHDRRSDAADQDVFVQEGHAYSRGELDAKLHAESA